MQSATERSLVPVQDRADPRRIIQRGPKKLPKEVDASTLQQQAQLDVVAAARVGDVIGQNYCGERITGLGRG